MKRRRQKAVSSRQCEGVGLRIAHVRIRTSDLNFQSLCNGQRSLINLITSRAIQSGATLRERIAEKLEKRYLRMPILRTSPTVTLMLVAIHDPRHLTITVTEI